MKMNPKLLKILGILSLGALLLAGCGKKKEAPEKPAATDAEGVPITLPDTLTVKRNSKTYVITGIGLSKDKKVAIINNEVVERGNEIDPGVILADVQPTYAVIQIGNTTHLIRPEAIQQQLNKR
jgi:hypothetical protein